MVLGGGIDPTNIWRKKETDSESEPETSVQPEVDPPFRDKTLHNFQKIHNLI